MYYSEGNGCLFSMIIGIVIMTVLSLFASLLFTPVGITLVIIAIGYHYYKKSRIESNKDINIEVENNNFDTKKATDEELSREAEDVDFKVID